MVIVSCVSAFSKRLFVLILCILLALGWAVTLIRKQPASLPPPNPIKPGNRMSDELAASLAGLEARERMAAETFWARELLAQKCGGTFEALWDSINMATNKWGLVASFPIGEIVLSRWGPPQKLPHGIERREPVGATTAMNQTEWARFVDESRRAGWQLAQVEFRHNRFEIDEIGQPKQSTFYFSAHITNSLHPDRAILEGDLTVQWMKKRQGEEGVSVKSLDASRLTIKQHPGPPPFQLILFEQITPPENAYSIDPLILYDLDGDGLSEIILAAKNVIYRRLGGGRYKAEPLCKHPPGLMSSALIGDFDGDGAADFLYLKHEGLVLIRGTPTGTFDEPERLAWPAPPGLKYPMVLTAGDIDHDGDLDLFLAQYKVPYEGGAMPTPFYDANDGHPAFLLRNDGFGKFTDATVAAGLEKKRWRRSYSASLVDLDDDGHMDLVVVSDFAGVDLYRGDGHGNFTDVTREWVTKPHAFGMAHAMTDFNSDGRLDLLMTGMTSPTVDRLEHLSLWRPGFGGGQAMRSQVMFGNRLYMARHQGGFEQTAASDSIARSGWAWGCSAADFDNDGFPDVYIANGLESRQSVRDYESEYWLHDLYVGNSQVEPVAYLYFKTKFGRTRGRGQSYGGYEKNRLFLNQKGASFIEIGHLMGVALEQDSRNVVSDDLDGDGRMDLVVTSFEQWPEAKQTLRVYENGMKEGGNWVGFRFREESGGGSPIGVRVVLHYSGHSAVRQIVTGDSYRSQHANTVHFGLGAATRVDSAEILWPNGEKATIREPALNRYHPIHARSFPGRIRAPK